MRESKTYTATDIQRYHGGQLSAAERHALEKAALDDPFLADALEGYAVAKTPSADLDALQQRLGLRIDKEKKTRGVFYVAAWMKIAAVLLIVAGGGWLVFNLSDKKYEALATRQSPVSLPSANNEKALDSTTVSSGAPVTAQVESVEKQKAAVQYKATQDNLVVRKTPVTASAQAPAGILNKPLPDSAHTDGYASRAAASQPSAQLSEVTAGRQTGDAKATDEEKKGAMAFKKSSAPFDKNSRFISPSTDTVKNVNVTLRRNELPPEQTVVLKGKAKEAPYAKRMNVTLDSLEPAGGWTNFDDYVSSNIKEPEEVRAKQLAGEVELSFDVNREGEAVNITVTKPLCDKCDEEAVRLLKEGPKWKKNKKKGRVKIKFPLTQ